MTRPATVPRPPRQMAGFLVTKQHRRFVEFADAVRRHRYIGACYGAPGLGKTLSARTYAAADDWDHWVHHRFAKDAVLPASLLASRTVMYTPTVTTTARQLLNEVHFHCDLLSDDIEQTFNADYDLLMLGTEPASHTELLIVDEADRLKTNGLEQLRDFFDRHDIGVILIGMPGFDRQLARYPQLYSRVGFAHQYRPLDPEDIQPVLARYWQQLHLTFDPVQASDIDAVNTITRITGGNFRLIERLMSQVARVLDINQLDTITTDVVQATRETLVVGAQ
ncbi:MAG TPA: AAA family ATPase [Mycobacterium sp.]